MQNLVSLPSIPQMGVNPLSNPARSVKVTTMAVVESVEALVQLSGVKMAMVVGHNEGSTKGGGNFIYQPEGPGLRIGGWIFQPGQTVTPYHFGALESGWDHDSGDALQKFLTSVPQLNPETTRFMAVARSGPVFPWWRKG